jgi:membrane-associated protease RseP (regulator of RpoE activity)
VAGEAAQGGNFGDIFLIFASFNVFIGILNLLPLPPFDGGHLAILAVEKVRRRKVDVRKLVPLTAAVATFLVLFMTSLIVLDIVKPVPNPFR